MKYQEWKWSSDFITNHEVIDFQHQSLFRVINDLIRACNESDTPNGLLVEVALDELLKYAGYHFREEEQVMEKHHYADLPAHREQHGKFVEVMVEFKKKFDNNVDITSELLPFMQKWLVDHILNRDKAAMKACV
jgi:hemerythrin